MDDHESNWRLATEGRRPPVECPHCENRDPDLLTLEPPFWVCGVCARKWQVA